MKMGNFKMHIHMTFVFTSIKILFAIEKKGKGHGVSMHDTITANEPQQAHTKQRKSGFIGLSSQLACFTIVLLRFRAV